MSEGMLAVLVGGASVMLAALQWYFSVRAAVRERDAEMMRWASEVIDLMAELEALCLPLSDATRSSVDAEALSVRASALVDRGRLFFRNVKPRRNRDGDEGTRVKILDKVLRSFYVARHLTLEPNADGDVRARDGVPTTRWRRC